MIGHRSNPLIGETRTLVRVSLTLGRSLNGPPGWAWNYYPNIAT